MYMSEHVVNEAQDEPNAHRPPRPWRSRTSVSRDRYSSEGTETPTDRSRNASADDVSATSPGRGAAPPFAGVLPAEPPWAHQMRASRPRPSRAKEAEATGEERARESEVPATARAAEVAAPPRAPEGGAAPRRPKVNRAAFRSAPAMLEPSPQESDEAPRATPPAGADGAPTPAHRKSSNKRRVTFNPSESPAAGAGSSSGSSNIAPPSAATPPSAARSGAPRPLARNRIVFDKRPTRMEDLERMTDSYWIDVVGSTTGLRR